MKEARLIDIADSISNLPGEDICEACHGLLRHARTVLGADILLCVIRLESSGPAEEPLILHATACEGGIDTFSMNAGELQALLEAGASSLLPVDLSATDPVLAREVLQGDAGHALLVPLHGPGGEYGIMLLGIRRPPRPWPIYVRAVAPELHLFAMRLFDCMLNNLRDRRSVGLTERERECLYWCAQGKSYWETSVILGITERTVNHHMRMVREKLGVQTNAQAVSLAFAHGVFKGYMPPGTGANDGMKKDNKK